MKKPHLPKIREILRKVPEGLTVNQLRPHLIEINKPNTIRKCLEKMPDAYIDRWILNAGNRGQYEAVWAVVVPPAHCPHPQDRFKRIETQWMNDVSRQKAP